MDMRQLSIIASSLLFLSSCGSGVTYEVTKEGHEVIGHRKLKPIGVHEELSPKTLLFLDNGDSVRISTRMNIPDTIWYEIRTVKH
jgi:hypothetical protein